MFNNSYRSDLYVYKVFSQYINNKAYFAIILSQIRIYVPFRFESTIIFYANHSLILTVIRNSLWRVYRDVIDLTI